jgi:hypothetical protein
VSVGLRTLRAEGCWRNDDQASRHSQPMSVIGDFMSATDAAVFGRIRVTS